MSNIIIIGISGASASGKTLLANTIVKELNSHHITMMTEDAYYKPLSHLSQQERTKINFDHPDSLDHELLHQHLDDLSQGKTVEVPIYDFATHDRSPKTRTIENPKIIILEGILIFVPPTLRDKMNIRIFMDTPLDICLIRRLKRDIAERNRTMKSVLEQYEETVRPMYFQFIEPAKRYADIIVPGGGANRIAIEMIKAKIRELLPF
jgi:uridine kinase